MSNSVFPAAVRGLTYDVTKTPEFSTILQRAVSAAETRIVNWINPIWHWELIYDYLRDDAPNSPLTATDLQTMMGFYMARQGQFDSFLYPDPDDNTVTTTSQTLSLLNIGGTYYTPVQRAMGSSGDIFYEDITDFNGTPQFYANGVLQTTPANYTLLGPGVALAGYSFAGYVIQWVGTPTGPITANFSFYFRVRFDMDKMAFDKFVNQLWTLGGSEASQSAALKLISARVPLA